MEFVFLANLKKTMVFRLWDLNVSYLTAGTEKVHTTCQCLVAIKAFLVSSTAEIGATLVIEN